MPGVSAVTEALSPEVATSRACPPSRARKRWAGGLAGTPARAADVRGPFGGSLV